VPGHGTKATPGLFPNTTAGKQAAQRCRDEGYLRALPCEAPAGGDGAVAVKARAGAEQCAITDKGLTYLLGQLSPRQVLEDFVRVLEQREGQVCQLLATARQVQADIEALRANAEKVLTALCRVPTDQANTNGDLKSLFYKFLHGASEQAPPATPPSPQQLEQALLAHLTRWAGGDRSEDCPLPDLFRHASAAVPELSIGQFHDALRRLEEAGQVYLHPWTGPLYEMPAPPYALLGGHEIAYYASLRG
jgi:hypothetical protein